MRFDIEQGGNFILRAISEETGESALRWEVDVISRVPDQRLIAAYTLFRGETKFKRLIGKFYAGGASGTAYGAMTALQKTLGRKTESFPLAAPRPLFYDSTLELIVQEFVEGTPYYDLIHGDRASFYFLEAGRALAALHRLLIECGKRRSLSDHLEELIHPHPHLFADMMPIYQPRIGRLINEMVRVEASWKVMETMPIHRDFHLRQLFHDEKQVWLIDWDLLSSGDPALDVGNFIVYLDTHLEKEKKSAILAFLEGYAPEVPATRLERVPVYKALTYLRLACKQFRLKEDLWQERVSEMLYRSEMALKERVICLK